LHRCARRRERHDHEPRPLPEVGQIGDGALALSPGVRTTLRVPLAQHQQVAHGKAAIVLTDLEGLVAALDGIEEHRPGLEFVVGHG
jgi:hypothetical protein